MPNEKRSVWYDADLELEAYRFEGITQKFPNHFHEYYVFGFVEAGERCLVCNSKEYCITPGDVVLFNPGDTHACTQADGKVLDYRSINIKAVQMERAALETAGRAFLPRFPQPVLYRSELAPLLQDLHRTLCEGEPGFIKDELYLFFIGQLLQEQLQEQPFLKEDAPKRFDEVCAYLEQRYMNPITLEELSQLINMSKYHFLRSFTRYKGITPYNYLETVRVNNAKKLLEQGVPPAEAAQLTGFHDQSHFTNFFKKLIGLTPRQYMRMFHGDGEA